MHKIAKQIPGYLRILFMCALAVTALFPFFWMVSTSLKPESEVFVFPPQLIPKAITFENYRSVFEAQFLSMTRALGNSLFIAVTSTAGALLTASLAAFSFAKINFRGKGWLFMVMLSTMMIPGQITLIPMFLTFKTLGWIDSYKPLIVPGILVYPYGVFLLRQFYASIPDAYVDSGRIDGASLPRIWAKIVMPLALPAMASLTLFKFMGSWNAFLGPMIYLNTSTKFTVPLVIRSFKTDYNVQWGLLLAASCTAVVPIMVLYLFTQRFFVDGIMIGGIKG